MKNWHQDNAYFRITPNKVMVSEFIMKATRLAAM